MFTQTLQALKVRGKYPADMKMTKMASMEAIDNSEIHAANFTDLRRRRYPRLRLEYIASMIKMQLIVIVYFTVHV